MWRRDLWPLRLRRAAIVVCGALVAISLLMFLSVQVDVTNGGATELIDGRANTSALLVPAALFVIGVAGLLAALGWRPRRTKAPE